MIRFVLPVFVFLLFIFEGTVFQLLAPDRFGVALDYIPRFVVVVIVLLSVFLGRTYGVLYGLGFGLLYDVAYTEMLGVYMFAMGFIGYFFALTYKPIQRSFTLTVITAVAAVCILEYFLFGLFKLLNVTTISHTVFFNTRLISTLGINLLFAAIVAVPLRKFTSYLSRMRKNLDE